MEKIAILTIVVFFLQFIVCLKVKLKHIFWLIPIISLVLVSVITALAYEDYGFVAIPAYLVVFVYEIPIMIAAILGWLLSRFICR